MQKFPKDPDMYVFFGDLPYKSILWRCDLDWHPGALGVDPNPTNGPQKPSRWSSGRLFFHVDRMIFGVEQHFLFLSVEQPGGLIFEKIKKSIHIYDYIWPIFSGAAFAIQFSRHLFFRKKSHLVVQPSCVPLSPINRYKRSLGPLTNDQQ